MGRGKGMWRLVLMLAGQWTITSWGFTESPASITNNNVNLLSVMSCYVKILMSRVILSRVIKS
jgi:hypothetical protein